MRSPTKETLCISLDLELYWGMRDIVSINDYQHYLVGVRKAVSAILKLFEKYEIHATWATVGFLHFQDVKQLQRNLPQLQPAYKRKEFNPYLYIANLEKDWYKELHFCPDLIESIRNILGQEIGTHTFSHYYCLESGQTEAEFKADLRAAIAAAKQNNLDTKSLVFPRNQYNQAYLKTVSDCGISCYRGNETHPIYNGEAGDGNRPTKRILRLLDTYFNLTGHNCYSQSELCQNYPINIPSSRFLRSYSTKLKSLDGLRLRRITSGLERAANRSEIYHLWWHPHNFGVNLTENISFLEKILQYYQQLNVKNEMQSLNMSEIANLCINVSQQMAEV